MKSQQPTELVLIQGMRGRGKTNSVKVTYQYDEPLFIIDIRNEYGHIEAFHSLRDFLLWLAKGGPPNSRGLVQYRLAFFNQNDYIKAFQLLTCFQNCVIIVDEADALFTHNKFQNGLINLFLGSRNNNLHLVFNVKRPFLIPIMIRSQVDKWIIFQTEEERDVKYLEKRLRLNLPKDPFKLSIGEAIVIEHGEAKIQRFQKWNSGG